MSLKEQLQNNKVTLGLTATGAIIGTAVLPGVGTAVGAGIGAAVGFIEKKFGGKTSGSGTTENPTTDTVLHIPPIKIVNNSKPTSNQKTTIHLLPIKSKPPEKLTPAIIKDAATTVFNALPATFSNDPISGLNHQIAVAALQNLISNPTAANLAATINTLGKNKSPEAQQAAVDLTTYTSPEDLKYWKE